MQVQCKVRISGLSRVLLWNQAYKLRHWRCQSILLWILESKSKIDLYSTMQINGAVNFQTKSCHANFLHEMCGIGMQECRQGWLSRIFWRNLHNKTYCPHATRTGNNPESIPIRHANIHVLYECYFKYIHTIVETLNALKIPWVMQALPLPEAM